MTRDLSTATNPVLRRRAFLRLGAVGGLGIATAALIGCSGDDDDEESTPEATEAASTSTAEATEEATATASPAGGSAAEGVTLPDGSFVPYRFPEPATTPKEGGAMVVGSNLDIGTVDPTVQTNGGTTTVTNFAYDTLLGFIEGPDNNPFKIELKPKLAKEYEISEDGLTYTFHLNEGVQFQNVSPLDGRDFTAADVEYAYGRYASEGVSQNYFGGVQGMSALDDLTFQITLGEPSPDFLVPVGSKLLTIHPRELVEDGTIEQRAIGTGPMIVTRFAQGEGMYAERNPDYWDGVTHIDSFEYVYQGDTAARVGRFRVGQFDYGTVGRDLRGYLELLDTNPDMQTNSVPVTKWTFGLGLNLQNPMFTDERVRQAMSLLMDRDLIDDLVFDGIGQAYPSIPWLFLFDTPPGNEVLGPWWRYEPDEAKKLLQAAGAEDLEFSAFYYPYPGIVSISEILIESFGSAGINMSIEELDYTEFQSRWTTGETKEASASGWSTSGYEANTYFNDHLRSDSYGNRWHINDPQIDEWAIQQSTELDPDARKEIHRKIWDRMLEKVYRLTYPASPSFENYQPWVRGLRFGGALISGGYNGDWGRQISGVWLDK